MQAELSPQGPDVSPPWMQGAKEIAGHEMLVVHMSDEELEGLDTLQGGPSIDPDIGIREYSKLAEIIEIPEVKQIFHHVADEIEKHGKISPDLEKIYHFAEHHSLPYKPTPEEKHNPLKKIEKTGRYGDKKLALIPLNFAFFLIELGHEPSVNPKTGLLEFGWGDFFKNVIRVAGSIGGAVIGTMILPGIGTAIGAGLGRTAAGMATGQKWGNAWKSGVRHGGTTGGMFFGGPLGAGVGDFAANLATGKTLKESGLSGLETGGKMYALQGLGQAAGLSGKTPYIGNYFAGEPNYVAQGLNYVKGGLGSLGVPGFSAAASRAPGGIESFISNNLKANALRGGNAGVGGGGSGFVETLKGIAPYALPLGTLGLAYMGSQKQAKHQEDVAHREEERIERERERMGFYKPWIEPRHRRRRYNPRFHHPGELEERYGVFAEPAFIEEERGYAKGGLVKSYKRGALVRGPGKGQDDKIKTSVPDGSYIIDASTTSMFGDGSTKAGSDILKEFEKHVKSKFPKGGLRQIEKEVSKKVSQVPVWLSEGEHKIDPVTVTLLGKGSNEKGAAILKEMVIKLRKHKISNGSGLPPKAKFPAHYLSQ